MTVSPLATNGINISTGFNSTSNNVLVNDQSSRAKDASAMRFNPPRIMNQTVLSHHSGDRSSNIIMSP